MPLDNNPKKIPQLTAIPTPTAGNETDIETVVAKESTYANYKMTLAQIYTLATVSGSIKTALDALSALIATNTSDIATLSSTKLNINGGLRTGLTAKAVICTDASGNEFQITGTSGQQIGFNGSNTPAAITPSVDIIGLTEKTTPVGNDLAIISDSQASGANKKIRLSSITKALGGNGSDGALSISSGTTTLTFVNGYIEKNYTSLTISGGTLNFSAPATNGGVAVIKVSGDCAITGGTIDISGMGAAGGPSISTDGSNGSSVIQSILITNKGINGGGTRAGGTGVGTFNGYYPGYCGAGGGALVSGTPSAGGNGGGLLIIEVNGELTFSSPATINANGAVGGTGSGGGGGGVVIIKANSIKSQTGTITVNGGNGGNGIGNNGGGGGGSYSNGGAGGASGGAAGTAGTSNAWGSGGTGGTNSGGGGGGAGFYKIN